ncbi:hypothetical protein [Bauldia litoralis]|uniref:hypothetical protein n=1 Tax=Bauldia litoralis TaxID=665467 RepID=UPI003265CC91
MLCRTIVALAFLSAAVVGALADDPAENDDAEAAARLAEMACAAHGPDFKPVPGTSTCIKVGGHMQVDVYVRSGNGR